MVAVLAGACPHGLRWLQPAAAAQDKPEKTRTPADNAGGKAPKRTVDRTSKRKPKAERPVREPTGRTQQAHTPVAKEQAPAAAHTSHSASAAAAALDPGASVRNEGGTEVKAMEFSGLDIEGALKTPQMLYFLKRLRAEFDHPRLPHRSFMPELARSTKEQDF
jgi:hypothetical protein